MEDTTTTTATALHSEPNATKHRAESAYALLRETMGKNEARSHSSHLSIGTWFLEHVKQGQGQGQSQQGQGQGQDEIGIGTGYRIAEVRSLKITEYGGAIDAVSHPVLGGKVLKTKEFITACLFAVSCINLIKLDKVNKSKDEKNEKKEN